MTHHRHILRRVATASLAALMAISAFLAPALASDIPPPDGPPANPAKLAAGDILVEANTSMKLPRGISARATYFIPAPLDKVRDYLPIWNPQQHAELEVQQSFNFAPDADPDFDALRLDEKSSPVRKLLAAMRDREGLQLTVAELAKIPARPTAETARTFWLGILRDRWQAFSTDGLKGAANGSFDARGEIRTLLAEEPKIASHFAALLTETPLAQDAPGSPVRCYWQQKTINGVAGFTIGAIYRRDSQFADLEFYVSSGYFVAFTLYELRSIEAEGKPGTLVWQENFASSPLLTGAFGLKRKLATMAIENDARRATRAFRKDAAR